MAFGDSMRFILTAPDGSEVLGDYIQAPILTGIQGPSASRNLQGYTRYCLESVTCQAADKSFSWYVSDWEPTRIKLQLEFDNERMISSTGGDRDMIAM